MEWQISKGNKGSVELHGLNIIKIFKNLGEGYNYLFETFIPMLEEAGLTQKHLNKILVENPRGLFK